MRGALLSPDAMRLSWRLFSSFEAFVNHKLYWGLESSIGDFVAAIVAHRQAPQPAALDGCWMLGVFPTVLTASMHVAGAPERAL
jgi:hypothetical protein